MENIQDIGEELFGSYVDSDLSAVAENITGEGLSNDIVATEHNALLLTGKSKLESNNIECNDAQLIAAVSAGLACSEGMNVLKGMANKLSTVGTDVVVPDSIIPRLDMMDITGESFTSRSPSDVASFHFNANLKLSKQNEVAETVFPTIAQPVGTVIFDAKLTVENVVNSFLRDGSKTGSNPRPITYDLLDLEGAFGGNGNRVYPVVGIKDEFDAFLDVDVKTEVKDPANGSIIETAPIKVGIKVPLLDISQSSYELANGVADESTTLSPGARINGIHIQVGTERYRLDASGFRDAVFYGTPNGNTVTDLQLVVDDEVGIKLGTLLKENGAVGSELTDGGDVTFVYNIRLSGTGSTVEKDLVVDVNALTLVRMIRTNGTLVISGDADYDTLKAVADKVTADAVKSVTIEAYLSNENLKRRNTIVTLSEKGEKYVLKPMNGVTVIVPPKGINGSYSDATLIDSLAKLIIPNVNLDAIAVINNAVNRMNSLTAGGTIEPTALIGIGSHLVKPTYVKATVDLSTLLNNHESKDKDESIGGTIITVIKSVIGKLHRDSGLADYREQVVGRSQDIAIVVGSDVSAFLPKNLKISDYNIKVVSSRVKQFQGKVIILPANFQSDRNSKPDFTSFGNYLYTPIMIGEKPNDGKIEYTAVPNGIHAVWNYVIGDITITGLDTVVIGS